MKKKTSIEEVKKEFNAFSVRPVRGSKKLFSLALSEKEKRSSELLLKRNNKIKALVQSDDKSAPIYRNDVVTDAATVPNKSSDNRLKPIGVSSKIAPLVGSPYNWHLRSPMYLSDMWSYGRGAGSTIAFIDGGFDIASKNLAGKWWSNPSYQHGSEDPLFGAKVGWNFSSNSANVMQSNTRPNFSHGTSVALTAVGVGVNNYSSAGVSPLAAMMGLAAPSSNTDKRINSESAMRAAEFACNKNANVVNMSFGNDTSEPNSYEILLESIIKRCPKTLFVASAGNSALYQSDNSAIKHYPAQLKAENLISVGAINRNLQRTSFSNYGEGVDVFTFGKNILLGGRVLKGTSFAAPIVSGAAAIIYEKNPYYTGRDVKREILRRSSQINGMKILSPLSVINPPRLKAVQLKKDNKRKNKILIKVKWTKHYPGMRAKCTIHGVHTTRVINCPNSSGEWIKDNYQDSPMIRNSIFSETKGPGEANIFNSLTLGYGVYRPHHSPVFFVKRKSVTVRQSKRKKPFWFEIGLPNARLWKPSWFYQVYAASRKGKRVRISGRIRINRKSTKQFIDFSRINTGALIRNLNRPKSKRFDRLEVRVNAVYMEKKFTYDILQ